jgi:hypothetical protein
VARCHDVADARAIAFNIVIHEVVKRGGSVACHPHEFRCERGRHQHLSEPPRICVHGGREAIGEPVARGLQRGQQGPSGESAEDIK